MLQNNNDTLLSENKAIYEAENTATNNKSPRRNPGNLSRKVYGYAYK